MVEVNLTSGLGETVLPPEGDEALETLAAALDGPAERRRGAVADVAKRWPTFLDAWAQLGRLGRDEVETYAYHRVGYHRGLDALRKNGWRGSGYVRWSHVSNRGFLRALEGLSMAAGRIGEIDEAQRCREFLLQLEPAWDHRPDPD